MTIKGVRLVAVLIIGLSARTHAPQSKIMMHLQALSHKILSRKRYIFLDTQYQFRIKIKTSEHLLKNPSQFDMDKHTFKIEQLQRAER